MKTQYKAKHDVHGVLDTTQIHHAWVTELGDSAPGLTVHFVNGDNAFLPMTRSEAIRLVADLRARVEPGVLTPLFTQQFIWTCGCGTVNGVNLATCRVCNRKEGATS
jgi:hypothetical protein